MARWGLVAAFASLVGCRATSASPPAPEAPHVVAAQPSGFKRCEAAPFDYPDPAEVPRPARVAFGTLQPDPTFQAMGVTLITFRSAELVFHVSPTLSQAFVDCAVAAADDAVPFVMSALALPPVFDGGPTRDVFLLDPALAQGALERLDPGFGFAMDANPGVAFVGSPQARHDAYAIFVWKKVRLDYLSLGALLAHEWTHMVQTHIRGRRPMEIDTVVEGEANLVGTMFEDATVPGAGTRLLDRDVSMLSRSRTEHPELDVQDFLAQRPHRYHEEVSLFSYLARSVDLPTLARVRRLARAELIDYESAWRRVVGRDLIDPGVKAVFQDPKLAPRPALKDAQAAAPSIAIVRSEDSVSIIARGFRAHEHVTRSVRDPAGHTSSDEAEADARGVTAWNRRLGRRGAFTAREVEVRGASGSATGTYYQRD